MKEKFGFIIASVFILIGLVKFDIFIYPTLDYFGKFVFVGALNIIPFWVAYMLNSKKQIFAIIWGILVGVAFYFMGWGS